MAYPKPLSEKSLAKLYQQSGLSQEQIDYLHRLFQACANLYGAVELRAVWDVYLAQTNAPRIRRRELIAFSGIARREANPYYVYEIDELYSEETRADLSREIVSEKLIRSGYGKFAFYDRLMESLGQEPYYIPKDILRFETITPSEEEKALMRFLNALKVTAKKCRPRYGEPYPCEHRGKRLSEFSFLNRSERFEEEYLTTHRGGLDFFRKSVAGTEAEKIFRQFWYRENTGAPGFNQQIERVTDELTEVGVELSMHEAETLIQLMMEYHNNAHSWSLHGWSPTELAGYYGPSPVTHISFGPNMQKMFAEGTMDEDEIARELQKRGMKIIK